MAKGSGGTKASGPNITSIDSLKQSSIFGISMGMQRYENEKNNPAYDFSNMSGLNDDERTYLVAYLSNAYRPINNALRNGEVGGDVKAMVSGIDKALSKVPTYSGEVYRGITFSTGIYGPTKQDKSQVAAILSDYKSKVGKEVTFNEYVSTGKDKQRIRSRFAYKETSIMFTIQSKNGHDLRKYNNEEKEILFERGTKFKVLGVTGNNVRLAEV